MAIRNAKELKRSDKGSMPFAMVAVALLLVSSTFCAIYANLDSSKDGTGDLKNELDGLDGAISRTKEFIREGIGKIIYEISADREAGTLTERVRTFDSSVERWFSQNFPRDDDGISVSVTEQDFKVDLQSTRMSTGNAVTDRSVVSYLRAQGQVRAEFSGDAGHASRTLDITADGTSGLPFIVDCATRFELSSEGDTSMLTQLVSYQLSSLAQYRIINGYGLRSAYGGMGTADIITKADVEKAFRNALSVVETLCFRSNAEGDGSLLSHKYLDIAERMVLKNGYYEIDVGSILSQSLLSIIDRLVINWVDYLGISEVIEIVDRILDVAREFINNVVSFFTGNHEDNRNSARVYIKEVMQSCGYTEEQYRYVMKGETSIHVNGKTLEFDTEYGMKSFTYEDFDITVSLPGTDVISWNGWENYVVDYERNRNAIADYVRNTLQTICSGMVSQYGIIRISADEFDQNTFIDSFTSAVDECLSRNLDKVTYSMESSLRNDKVTDMLLASIYRTMVNERDSIFNIDEELLEIKSKIGSYVGNLGINDNLNHAREFINAIVEEFINKDYPEISWIRGQYEKKVDDLYALYDSVMNSPRNQGSSVLKELVITSGKKVLRQDYVRESVISTARDMMAEIKEYMRMTNDYGVIEMEMLDRFSLYDGYGNIREEYTDIIDSYDLDIQITDPTRNSNYHSVSMKNDSNASYVSVFTVTVFGKVDYLTHSMSGVDRSLGRYDSAFKGDLNIDMRFDIPCVSAWSLRGASYSASTNIYKDAWNVLLNAVEPLLEPLKKIYNEMKEIYSICMETAIEINSYATELIDRLYSAIMEPLETLAEMIRDWVSERLCWLVENLCGFVEGFDIGASSQRITFSFFGLSLTVELRLATALKTTKNIVKLTLEGELGGTRFSAFVDLKKNDRNGLMVRGGGGIENDDCALNIVIDPDMKFGSKLVKLDGNIRDVSIDACFPYKELYDEFEMKLTDIPGVKEAVSNIALPIPGFKGCFDMGVDLKYNLPLATGLLINEFESNPEGSDNGTEWVELYNATARTIDLRGYVLVPESNESKAFVITGMSIGPLEKKVVMFQKQSLNNSKSGTHNGESISLYSPEGEKIDSTPWKKDSYNDDRTWQRKADGSTSWIFAKGTPDGSNGNIVKTNVIAKEFLIDSMLKAADKAFEEMGNHLKSIDDITRFLERTLQLFVKNVIDKIADIIVSASVFISLELADYAETQHYGMKVAFEMNSDLVREGIYWLLKQIGILQDIVREPKCNDPVGLVCQNTYLTSTVYTSISTPKFLSTLESKEIYVGFKAGVNITGLSNILWGEDGDWKAVLGIVAEDIDPSKLPKGLRSEKDKHCDLWLVKVELGKVR